MASITVTLSGKTNANLHWPPPMSMMTMGMSGTHASIIGEDTLVSAATPVPFEASSSGMDLGARSKGVQQSDRVPEQGNIPDVTIGARESAA
eukprot:1146711-Pelagomonas_calceolata.AAC.3